MNLDSQSMGIAVAAFGGTVRISTFLLADIGPIVIQSIGGFP